jgi:phenylalanyl-tRNA synthetase beta chain
MNILIPHNWLKEYLKTEATPEEIQKNLSLCGPSIERIYERENEAVYDIEITTNRVDSMSVYGIAREAAVILKRFKIPATLKPITLQKPAAPTHKLQLPQILDDQHLTKRVMCVILADVQRNSTPEWMAKRLRQIDGTVHDAVIDITNYITHELGHPCHAFDYDKVMELGGIIEITLAKPGKKFVTLDGVEHTTVGGEVVFENGDGVIMDLPGIKGTANTSIHESTKNILFWLENIEAKKKQNPLPRIDLPEDK